MPVKQSSNLFRLFLSFSRHIAEKQKANVALRWNCPPKELSTECIPVSTYWMVDSPGPACDSRITTQPLFHLPSSSGWHCRRSNSVAQGQLLAKFAAKYCIIWWPWIHTYTGGGLIYPVHPNQIVHTVCPEIALWIIHCVSHTCYENECFWAMFLIPDIKMNISGDILSIPKW